MPVRSLSLRANSPSREALSGVNGSQQHAHDKAQERALQAGTGSNSLESGPTLGVRVCEALQGIETVTELSLTSHCKGIKESCGKNIIKPFSGSQANVESVARAQESTCPGRCRAAAARLRRDINASFHGEVSKAMSASLHQPGLSAALT